jgi:replication factor A1
MHIFLTYLHNLNARFLSSFRDTPIMNSTAKFVSITPGQQNCKVFGRLIRLWDAKNMSSKAVDPLISIDGVILDEDVRNQTSPFKKTLEQTILPH